MDGKFSKPEVGLSPAIQDEIEVQSIPSTLMPARTHSYSHVHMPTHRSSTYACTAMQAKEIKVSPLDVETMVRSYVPSTEFWPTTHTLRPTQRYFDGDDETSKKGVGEVRSCGSLLCAWMHVSVNECTDNHARTHACTIACAHAHVRRWLKNETKV